MIGMITGVPELTVFTYLKAAFSTLWDIDDFWKTQNNEVAVQSILVDWFS